MDLTSSLFELSLFQTVISLFGALSSLLSVKEVGLWICAEMCVDLG